MNGVVRRGPQGKSVAKAKVTLHGAGIGAIASVTTGDDGTFAFDAAAASTAGAFYYATSDLGDGVVLMTILGYTPPSSYVINELTTVAAAYSGAQCFTNGVLTASTLALNIVAAMNANLVDVTTGDVSAVMTTSPNSDQTNAYRSLMSLANFLAAAVDDHGKALENFFKLTTLPPPAPAPSNTVEGLANIARNPAYHTGGIYAQSLHSQAYTPVVSAQPIAWTIVVKVNNSGDPDRMFGGPGSLEFDTQGNAWIPNNVVQKTPNSSPYSIVLDLSGRPLGWQSNDAPLSPFEGGGLRGAGFGVAVDTANDYIWMGNFGWGNDIPEQGGVSKFSYDGTSISPLSPDPYGYTNGGMNRVQGTVFCPITGNIWTAGWGNGTVVCYRRGNPNDYTTYTSNPDTFKPFGIATTKNGTAWVTNSASASSSIVHLEDVPGQSLKLLKEVPIGKVLKGIQIDSGGRVWVASGGDHHIYVFDEYGNYINGYQGGGTNGPWGIRLDGDDNLWVGNFGPLELGSIFHGRLTQLAGADTPGYHMGDGMTPPTGYTLPSENEPVMLADNTPLYGNDAPPSYIPMMRTTGLNIDAAGNVWTCNNWKPDFDSDLLDDPWEGAANPGGDGMLIWVGLAKPPQ